MAVPVPTGGQIMTGGTAEGRDRLKTMDWDELGYSRNNALWLRLPETPHRPQQKTADGPLLDRPFLPRSRYFSHTKPSALYNHRYSSENDLAFALVPNNKRRGTRELSHILGKSGPINELTRSFEAY